jgi:hypothetical protein
MTGAHHHRLVLEHKITVLQVAVRALQHEEVAAEQDLAELGALSDAQQELECSTIACLQSLGVSWDRMAGSTHVTRQSLHRRMSRRVDKWTRDRTSMKRSPERELQRLTDQLVKLTSDLQKRAAPLLHHDVTDQPTLIPTGTATVCRYNAPISETSQVREL